MPVGFDVLLAVPNFLIIGVQKGGTTSLYRYLLQHPQVVPAVRKEVHFFDLHYDRGLEWYRAQFPASPQPHGCLVGEASPYYIFHPLVAHRVYQTLPDAKIIVLLRDPVDRVLSHYFHEVRWGFETLGLEAALACEVERLAGEAERMLDDGSYQSFNYQHYSYLKRSCYVEQLMVWRSLFPASQLLVLCSEMLYSDPGASLGRVVRFLELEPFEFSDFEKHNAGEYQRPSDQQIQDLRDYFRPQNALLWRYLQRDAPESWREEFQGGGCWPWS